MKHINSGYSKEGVTWNSDLAYVIGLITTDGSLSSDKRHIAFVSKDYDLIRTFITILNLKVKIASKKSSYNPNGRYYLVQFGDVKFYNLLLKIGLTPNKTKTMGTLAISDTYFADFLRGHLDGDGSTYSYYDKKWKSSFRIYTQFHSASKKHLEWIESVITRMYLIKGSIRYKGKSTFVLEYAKKSSIILLQKLYHKSDLPCLERKRFKIKEALGIIEHRADVLKLVYRHA